MGTLVEFARQVLDQPDELNVLETAGPILAVKIINSLIGDYWLILDEIKPFDPCDGLPIYRPSEIRVLIGKGYAHDALQAVHGIKRVFDGKLVH